MTFGETFIDICVRISLVILAVSFVICVVRIVIGPTLPDRILALDMLVALGIGFIAAIGVKTNFYLYLDIAISLGLVGFLATVAFARFILNRGLVKDQMIIEDADGAAQERGGGQ
ncbi:MAG: cation:proton antiporter [Stappiaceae bacterium]